MTVEQLIFSTREEAEAACVAFLGDLMENALRGRGHTGLMLSGGSTPARVLPPLLARSLDWARVDTVASDERVVPVGHVDSTEGLISGLFRCAERPLNYAGTGGVTDPHYAVSAWRAARARQVWPPAVGLIGIGEDGHTASLFPGRREASDPDLYDAAVPETPPHQHPRLTLGLAALADCPALALVVAGPGKRAALDRDPAGLFAALSARTRVVAFASATA